jgi:hypothetical protein
MPDTAIDISPEAREVATLALSIPDAAKKLAITDDISLSIGNELLLSIKDLRKQIADTFDPIIRKAHEAHKAAVGAKKDAEAPLVQAEGIVKPAISGYMAALAAAIEAEDAGASPEEVQAIVEAPVYVPPPVAPPPPKLSGVSIRKVVKFEVTDLRALIKAIAAGQVPIEAVKPNDVVIGAQARSLRTSLRWPGVKVWEEPSVAAGRR